LGPFVGGTQNQDQESESLVENGNLRVESSEEGWSLVGGSLERQKKKKGEEVRERQI
jgi:hypothetical protein